MKAHALGRDAAERVIDRLDAPGRPCAAFLDAKTRVHHVVSHETRVVDLQYETRVHDRAVLLVERVGQSLLVLLVGAVEAVRQRRKNAGRRVGGKNPLLGKPARRRGWWFMDANRPCRLAWVPGRPRADAAPDLRGVPPPADPLCDAFRPRVVIGKVQVLAAART